MGCGQASRDQGGWFTGDVRNLGPGRPHRALRAKAALAPDGSLERELPRVRITIAIGRVHEFVVERLYGSKANRMTDADFDANVATLCAPILGEARSAALIETCRGVSDLRTLAVLADAARHWPK